MVFVFEEASLGAIACIAMQGIRRLELQPGEKIAIVGLGLIGQMAFRLAKAMGYQPVGFDIDQGCVELAEKMDRQVLRLTHQPPIRSLLLVPKLMVRVLMAW